jgi:predicted dehydrogenase
MIRIGILSFAHYHANFWAEALNDEPRATLAGIWDADVERGRQAAAKYNTAFFEDLEALLAAVDAVAVTSETAEHRRLIERAVARGRHVLCEKPIATTLEDADAIAAAVAKAGVVFMQSFPKRFDPVNHEIRRLLDAKALGKLWLVRVRHGHRHGLSAEFTRGWWVDPARSGGGTLIDEGVHATDFLRWMFGEPQTVQATIAHNLGLAVEDTAVATYRWADGLVADVSTGWMFHAADSSVEIYGTEGSILLSGVDIASRDVAGNPAALRFSTMKDAERRWVESPIVPQFIVGKFHHQNAIAFVESLTARKQPPIGLEDGRGALAMILAAYEAARRGATVDIAAFAKRPAAIKN